MPDTLGFNEAASVPLVFLTAFHMLTGRASVRPGHTCYPGCQFGCRNCRNPDCKAISSDCNRDRRGRSQDAESRELGADHVINHYQQKIGDEAARSPTRRGWIS